VRITKTRRVGDGVLQRDFEIEVAGEAVPGVIWTPDGTGSACLAMGHGGSQHKKTADIRIRAVRYASRFGWVSFAIDAPGHGNRISAEEAAVEQRRTLARLRGDADAVSLTSAAKNSYLNDLAAQAVPEWRAALDAVLESDLLVEAAPIGYWGVSMGTSIGVPLLASEARFQCAVLGLGQLHPDHVEFEAAAQRVTVPLRFALQWDYEIRTREYGIALFEAFGAAEKSLHINPGGHLGIPPAEAESWELFYQRYLV
jgi:hypothetical protein